MSAKSRNGPLGIDPVFLFEVEVVWASRCHALGAGGNSREEQRPLERFILVRMTEREGSPG